MTPRYTKAATQNVTRQWDHWFTWRTENLPPCCYCGCALRIPSDCDDNTPDCATKEHMQPMSRGGQKTEWVWSCLKCNRDKHHLTVNEYRIVLMYRRRRPVLFSFERSILSTLIGIVANYACLWCATTGTRLVSCL